MNRALDPDAPGLLASARQALDARQFAEAKALAETVLNAIPNQLEACFLVAVAAEGMGDFDSACANFAKVYETRHDLQVGIRLATCLWRVDRLDEALACIDEFDDGTGRNHDLALVKATVLHGLGRFEESRNVAEIALAANPDSALLAARLGATLMRLSLFDQARKQLLRAAKSSARLDHCRLVRVDREAWMKLNVPVAVVFDEAHMVHESSGSGDTSFVVLVACDGVYLDRYATAFVRSFAANASKSAGLHLHVIDPDESFPEFLDGLIGVLHGSRVRVTIQYTPDDIAEQLNARRTFYSCARFLRLPELLRSYALPVVLLDVDAVIETSLDGLAALANEHDVALLQRSPPDSPWLDVIANHMVVAPTGAAIRFAERLRNFIARCCRPADLKWHLDQIALYCVDQMTRAYGEPIRICAIPPEQQQHVWHIGNPYRYLLEDDRFRRYATPFGERTAD